NERTVRARLHKIAGELDTQARLPDGLSIRLVAIRFESDDPLSILERTEGLLTQYTTTTFESSDEALADRDRATRLMLELIIVQSLAARLGLWAARGTEMADARTARAQYKELGEPHWSKYRSLVESAQTLYKGERYKECARA